MGGLGKKGSHVGMVLSFVVFVTFVIFVYSILGPSVFSGQGSSEELKELEKNLAEEISGNFSSLSVVIENSGLGDCVIFTGLVDGNFVVVKNSNGGILNSEFNEGVLKVESQGENFLKIYSSEEEFAFSGVSGSCLEIGEGDYSIGSSREQKMIFETRMRGVVGEYGADYETLKEKLGMTRDFSFSFVLDDSEEIGEISSAGKEVYADRIPISYVDSQAEIKSGFINIRVW